MRTILLFLVTVAACGGDPPVHPGGQSYVPPTMQQGSGGKPSGATSVTCSNAADCDYWFCECSDGAVVNSALCVNDYCMDAASACPQACDYFQHGAWTGTAGGGPGSIPHSCGSLGSHDETCDACFRTSCCDEGTACGQTTSCLDYWDCAVACNGDPQCREDCDAQYPDGRAPYQALEGCLADNCSTQCAGGM